MHCILFCHIGCDENGHLDNQNSRESSFEEMKERSRREDDSNDDHNSGENDFEEAHENGGHDSVDIVLTIEEELRFSRRLEEG